MENDLIPIPHPDDLIDSIKKLSNYSHQELEKIIRSSEEGKKSKSEIRAIRKFELDMCYHKRYFKRTGLDYSKGSPKGKLFLAALYDVLNRNSSRI